MQKEILVIKKIKTFSLLCYFLYVANGKKFIYYIKKLKYIFIETYYYALNSY